MGQAFYGLLRDTSRHSQPWQVAGAMTLGCFLGLMPKFNLLFPLGLVLLSLLPLHFAIAASCIAATSCLAVTLHPAMGAVGGWLLSVDAFRSVINRLELVPLLAWLRLHNTIIVGWLGVSVICSPPVFFFLHRRILLLRLQWLHQQIEEIFTSDNSVSPDRTVEAFETKISISRTGGRDAHDSPPPDDSLFNSEFMVANQQTIQLHQAEAAVLPNSTPKPLPQTRYNLNENDLASIENDLASIENDLASIENEASRYSIGDTEVRRDEALRHLLNHLRTVKEKV
jgi:uncharacterized protein (TIGR03546 family)